MVFELPEIAADILLAPSWFLAVTVTVALMLLVSGATRAYRTRTVGPLAIGLVGALLLPPVAIGILFLVMLSPLMG